MKPRSPIRYSILLLGLLLYKDLAYCQAGYRAGSPLDDLPDHITQITHFGQRPEWSPDGKTIMFMERAFGDVYQMELETGKITHITHHFPHEGFTRAFYLSNGDILLVGARHFDAKNPRPSRTEHVELWVMDKSYTKPPVPLGVKCWEGPAVSRNQLLIAYAKNFWQYPEVYGLYESQIFMASIEYDNGVPRLGEEKLLVDSRNTLKKAMTHAGYAPSHTVERWYAFSIYLPSDGMRVDRNPMLFFQVHARADLHKGEAWRQDYLQLHL